jgi:CubicO group peptidase (beta-lactamase class C family)
VTGALDAEPDRVGFRRDDPLVVAGRTPTAEFALERGGLDAGSLLYAASLAKQVTAACLALLCRRGVLDLDSPVRDRLPELPAWADEVHPRHLLHHTGALPPDDVVDAHLDQDRTTAGILAALASALPRGQRPGTAFAYSNAGYACLGLLVERACGSSLPQYARRHLFGPAGMDSTRFWSGPGPAPPGAVPLDPARPAPLSLGDGGMWSTAADLLRWCRCLDDDLFGISAQLQVPGLLDDGTPLDYAWGTGVRQHAGRRVYRHGGAWADLRAVLVRSPERGVALVSISTGDHTERGGALADALLDLLLA